MVNGQFGIKNILRFDYPFLIYLMAFLCDMSLDVVLIV